MMGKGWTDGSDIRSRPSSKEYRDNYDYIFRRRQKVIKEWEDYQEKCERQRLVNIQEARRKHPEINGN